MTPNAPAAVVQAVEDFRATTDAIAKDHGSLESAPLPALVPANIAGFAMMQVFETAIEAGDAAMPAEALTFGADGALDPSTLLGAAQALCDQSALVIASGYFGRAVVNVENATG